MQRVEDRIEPLRQRLAAEWISRPAHEAETAIKRMTKFWIKHFGLVGKYMPHQGEQEKARRLRK